jgi:hypothetical protein
MFKSKVNLALIMIVTLGLSACASTEQKMMEAGATRMNGAQATAHISGNTEKWSKGGGYYNPNGTLEVIWKGAELSGPYTVADDGNVCYEVADWGKECHFYMNENGAAIMIYKGKRKADANEMMAGNKLSQL